MAEYRWFVAQTLPGLESTAIYHLSREGITAFSPILGPSNPKRPPVRLYPGYAFIELERPEEASIVNRMRGIRKVLPIHAKSPLPLPPGFVEEMRERAARPNFAEEDAEAHLRRFVGGESVLISIGPFSGHEGRFLRYHKGCGVILAALLGRELELRIPLQGLGDARNYGGQGARSAPSLAA